MSGRRDGDGGRRVIGGWTALLLVTAPMAGALPACGGGEGGPDVTVRDSAGAEIVENAGEAVGAAPAWSLAPEPSLDIGVVEGDSVYQLDDVEAARRLPDGGVAVADGGSSEIRVYGPDGTFLHAAGGPGEGPGEFSDLTRLYRLPGDSLLAYDRRQHRLSLFSPGGEFVRSEPVSAVDSIAARADLAGLLAGRTRLLRMRWLVSGTPEEGLQRYPETYLLEPPGGPADSLLTLPGDQFHLEMEGRAMAISTLPFGLKGFVAAGGDRVVAGYNDRYEVRQYSGDGELLRRIRLDRAPEPITEADVDRMVEARTEATHDEEQAREMASRIREMPLPEVMPVFEALAVDAAGDVWVKDFVPPGVEANRWTVFGPRGRVTATLELPPRFEPLEIGRDYVLGRWQDELDVEHVRLYGLARGEGSGS